MNTQYALKTLNQLRPVLIGFRKANGLTQRDVSERLGVTQQTYARLEANPASVGFERLFRVFSVLGVEIVLSSREPLSDAMPEYGALHNDSSLPARREKW
ncbi:helix-turn-helix transcriptional regulator [Salmonella enterica subsp. enterica serovar 4,12:d:-]|uniref:helix-turn-helix domain-containing protein n=1 Tax=Enterobacteriaceae TaxID=543 RepID=UPI000485F046|nr:MULTISPECIES: helix-turn-helix transcriptional regulator [Enterobacteriaceae]EAU1883888.1 XRE family transcriptional regulator [Salmonella enterica]EAV3183363.1 XRE family transcriptional regulator [Salmonella enterica subsp. enterica]ECD6933605.1 XRE family transcriptional regulator [Salmonella enterica subsp. enterica serovar Saintpaul]ECQ6701292.1 helix-turn-helix transcriptional regulator [Salmonella enterica subsp. enterica serovar Senftenberg]EDF3926698.1 helix-turn-helix domain-conta